MSPPNEVPNASKLSAKQWVEAALALAIDYDEPVDTPSMLLGMLIDIDVAEMVSFMVLV